MLTFAETFIGVAVPTNPSTGVNVTSPVVGSTCKFLDQLLLKKLYYLLLDLPVCNLIL